MTTTNDNLLLVTIYLDIDLISGFWWLSVFVNNFRPIFVCLLCPLYGLFAIVWYIISLFNLLFCTIWDPIQSDPIHSKMLHMFCLLSSLFVRCFSFRSMCIVFVRAQVFFSFCAFLFPLSFHAVCMSAWVCFGLHCYFFIFVCMGLNIVISVISPARTHNISIWSFQCFQYFEDVIVSAILCSDLWKWHTLIIVQKKRKNQRFREIGFCFEWAKLMSLRIHRWHYCALAHCITAQVTVIDSTLRSLDSFMFWNDFWRAPTHKWPKWN